MALCSTHTVEGRTRYVCMDDIYILICIRMQMCLHIYTHIYIHILYNYGVMLDTHCRRKDEVRNYMYICIYIYTLYNYGVMLDTHCKRKDEVCIYKRYLHINIYTNRYTYICIYIRKCLYIHIYLHINIYPYANVYSYIYISIFNIFINIYKRI
jgi:hypothetical protein